MPRRARTACGGIVYHVLNRAAGRMRLFARDRDYEAFERTLEQAHQRHPLPILDWCLMPNHWHLVLWPRRDGELSAFMFWLTMTHTQRRRTAHHAVGLGPLYQGRFKAFPVQSDEHLRIVCRYVERNALRAGLVERAEDSAPVTFAAWPGETPVIDGGEPLTGWQATTLNGKDAWVASVTGHFRSLFVNGRRALRPRLPKQGLYWVEYASAASAAPRTAGAPRRRATCPCAYSACGRWSPATALSSWTPFPATSNGRAVRSSLPTGRSTRAGGEEHPAHWRSNVSPRPGAGGWSKQRAGKEEDND